MLMCVYVCVCVCVCVYVCVYMCVYSVCTFLPNYFNCEMAHRILYTYSVHMCTIPLLLKMSSISSYMYMYMYMPFVIQSLFNYCIGFFESLSVKINVILN